MKYLPVNSIRLRSGAFWLVLTFLFCLLMSGSTLVFAQGIASLYSSVNGPTLPQEVGREGEHYLDPSDFILDAQGEYFYIACAGSNELRRARVDGSEVVETLPLEFSPTKLAFFPDQTRVAVIGGLDQGRLAIVEIARKTDSGREIVKLNTLQTRAIGHSPVDVVVRRASEEQEFIYVSHCFLGQVHERDAQTLELTRTWDAGREPYCMALTPNGQKLVIGNRITAKKANVAFSCATVNVLDLVSGEMATTDLLNGHNLLQDMVLSSDGHYAFISAVQCSYLSITSQVSGGWISENCVLVIDVDACELVEIFFLDDAEMGSGNPWGIACSEDGERLIVSIAGTDELIYLPLKRLLETLDSRPKWARPGYGAYSYATFAKGEVQLPFRIRTKLGFKGMRQLAVHGDDVYALCRFDDVICKATMRLTPPFRHYPDSYVKREIPPTLELEDQESAEEELTDAQRRERDQTAALVEANSYNSLYVQRGGELPLSFNTLAPYRPMEGVVIERSFARLAPRPTLTMRRRGEILFHDATACFESWLSCVTCHPDARSDGFNWDLLNDGTGNLKNTKSMLLAHETPPCMISGIRSDAEVAVRAGFTHILFTHYKEENACCVDEYLMALEPTPSPRLVDGKLSESAQRGKAIFESEQIGCAQCHFGPYYTDLQLHRTGTQDPNDFIDKFDTPTLIEAWRTAPYMNTGEYLTIRDVLVEGKHGVKDGQFERLSEQEQNDLIEFILSL
ncbi:MAG: hypothetical protein Q4G03_10240 [Planctomycetia bacterium]|nr:hypothetical protein [Planctomycetia bacterium]